MNRYVDIGDFISRGPRPGPEEFAFIKSKFASTLSLEGLEEDDKEVSELAPTKVICFPITFLEIYTCWYALSQKRLQDILDAIALAPKPLLIHCQHGQDRTGLVCAAYRVRVCGWTKDQAMKEALSFGYRDYINFGLNKTWEGFSASPTA